MAGIFPQPEAGAVPASDPNAEYAYEFPVGFNSCDETALPSSCEARILPSQINAIVSELACFGARLNPDGQWVCEDICNLSNLFAQWSLENKIPDGVTIGGAGTTADPWHVIPDGVAGAVCGDDTAARAMAACIRSTDAVNGISIGSDGKLVVATHTLFDQDTIKGNGEAGNLLHVDPTGVANAISDNNTATLIVVQAVLSDDINNILVTGTDGRISLTALRVAQTICADDTAGDTLAACMRSSGAGNLLAIMPDGRLGFQVDDIANAICADVSAGNTLAACLISTEPGNALGVDGTNRMFVHTTTADEMAAAICGDATAKDTLAACLIDEDPANKVVSGPNGGIFVPSTGAVAGFSAGAVIASTTGGSPGTINVAGLNAFFARPGGGIDSGGGGSVFYSQWEVGGADIDNYVHMTTSDFPLTRAVGQDYLFVRGSDGVTWFHVEANGRWRSIGAHPTELIGFSCTNSSANASFLALAGVPQTAFA